MGCLGKARATGSWPPPLAAAAAAAAVAAAGVVVLVVEGGFLAVGVQYLAQQVPADAAAPSVHAQ